MRVDANVTYNMASMMEANTMNPNKLLTHVPIMFPHEAEINNMNIGISVIKSERW
jgi:hypothetical protein